MHSGRIAQSPKIPATVCVEKPVTKAFSPLLLLCIPFDEVVVDYNRKRLRYPFFGRFVVPVSVRKELARQVNNLDPSETFFDESSKEFLVVQPP